MTTVTTSYWPADTSVPVLDTTVGGVLRAAAAAGPDMPAMVAGLPDPAARRRWTYAELLAGAEQAARALTARFAPGERVAAWAPNLPEWVILEYAAAPAEAALPEVSPDDVAQIQYTSGTTGFPKGAELHHRGLTNNARFWAERMELRPGEAYVNPMPLFHAAGCGMGVLGAAQSLAVQVPVLAFDPALVLELMEAERAAVFAGVPTMMIAMLGHPDIERRDLSSLRAAVSGGSPVPAGLVRQVEERLDVRFSIVFGTTECSPLVTQVRLDESEQDRAETLGTALPQTEIMIADVDGGGPVPVSQPGELCARGYTVMRGYHDAPEATAAAIDGEGWYHTGDLASLDSRGYLRIEGRIKDMIIRGGENIYPREIEDVLFGHPAVAEAVVIGVPDEKWGEAVAAYVRPVPGRPAPSPEELRAYCRERLAPYKTPLHWVFTDAFPMTPSGKIQKFKLRESFAGDQSAGPPATR